MGKPLVIVESPAKAKTIARFLKDEYRVEACIGHIRDLPDPKKGAKIPAKYKKESWARLGINVEDGFKPLYVLTDRGKEQVKFLKACLSEAPALYLATDEDREGEAIAWHLVEALAPEVPVFRLAFHEITEDAIREALAEPRTLNMAIVEAQETRRLVDRLFGYNISPLLWRKVRPKLSAGRVQSVAVRLIVDRERVRMQFREANWWDLSAEFTSSAGTYGATLHEVGGNRIAMGRDFEPTTGELKPGSKLHRLDEASASALKQQLESGKPIVDRVEETAFTERPQPPFTTSTLQQEVNRRFRWPAKKTMRTAQQLYEDGWITYMRTDSTNLSSEALQAARLYIKSEYGSEYCPDSPRHYKTKSSGAQEAHEAIRPAGQSFKSIADCRSQREADQAKLYELIFKRTVACQMVDAHGTRAVMDTRVGDALFRSRGKVYKFKGYRAAYVQTEITNTVELGRGDVISELPNLAEGSGVGISEVSVRGHTTQPVARLTEATLVKELEARGIGRPSTYASIIGKVQDREYVFKKGSALVPTWTAIAVTRLMEQHFESLVNYDFTAQLETGLDEIAQGQNNSLAYLQHFYGGESKEANGSGLKFLLASAEENANPREVCSVSLGEADGDSVLARVGKWGPYLEHGERRGKIPEGLAPDELRLSTALEFLAKQAEGPLVLGTHPETNDEVTVRDGRFGPYVQLGEMSDDKKAPKPPRQSLLKGMSPESMTLEIGLALLSLPRDLGPGTSGEPVLAHNGRYGPYLRCGDETRNIPADISLLEINLEQALVLLAQPSTKGKRASPKAISELGKDGEGRPVKLMDGRYGPYVTDGAVNASLPKGTDASGFSLESALELLEKKHKNPTKRKARKR